jgi:hypothetical protein
MWPVSLWALGNWVDRSSETVARERSSGSRPSRRELLAVLALAIGAGGLSLFITHTVLEGIPHVSDDIAYAFQARIFASGRLCLQPPLLPKLFRLQNIILDSTHWCSKYPPGWPAILALGVLTGTLSLVNPILLALSVIGVWQLARRLFDARTGVVAAGALAASPFALLMGAGFMAHVATLCACVWCLVALATAEARRPARLAVSSLLAGVCAGTAFAIRPYSAVALLWPAILWYIWRQRRDGRWRIVLGSLTLGALPGIVSVFGYNWLVFGSPVRTGYQVYKPLEVTVALGLLQSPIDLLSLRLPMYLLALNRSLWGWPWPDLLMLLPLLWSRSGRQKDGILLACSSSLILGYSLYYYFDIVYGGPRLVFESLGPFAVLLARSLLILVDGLDALGYARRLSGHWRAIAVQGTATVALLALVTLSFSRHLLPQLERHGRWYHGQSALPLRQAEAAGVGSEALVFVSGPDWVFGSFFLHNDLQPWHGARVFVRDIPYLRTEASRFAPRAETWRVRIVLETIPGPNAYPDTFRAELVRWERVQ